MKLVHIADLHLGKRVHGFSLLEDQRHVLEQIIALDKREDIDAVLLAGDIYDKSVPAEEAVHLFDWFLGACRQNGWRVLCVPGNHDSAERLGFAAGILARQGVHLAGPYAGEVPRVTLEDGWGPVRVHLLGHVKSAHIRRLHPDVEPGDTEGAVRAALASARVDPSERNLLVAHQFVTHRGQAPERSDSELASVGGLDAIDASVFDGFDYVALGHIHRPQRMGRDSVRYAGSLLKYSFSEEHHHKSATLVTLGAKGDQTITTQGLAPLHDMRTLEGHIDELLDPAFYAGTNRDDYLQITLRDESALDAMGRLRLVYPNIMRLAFAGAGRGMDPKEQETERIMQMDPFALFEEFYCMQNGDELRQEQKEKVRQAFQEAQVNP